MSLVNLDKMPIEFECQHCGKKLSETMGRLKKEPSVTCPNCGNVTEISIEGADKAQRDVDAATRKLERTLKDLGKRR